MGQVGQSGCTAPRARQSPGLGGLPAPLPYRCDGRCFDPNGDPAGDISALAQTEAENLLAVHRERQQVAVARCRRHQTLEKTQQTAKTVRLGERERQANEKQRWREANERNYLKNLTCKIDPVREGLSAATPVVAYASTGR